jgi:hypothetical protein
MLSEQGALQSIDEAAETGQRPPLDAPVAQFIGKHEAIFSQP